MDAAATTKHGNTKPRWLSAMREAPFDLIRHHAVIETKPEQFLRMLSNGTVCTNIFLRRLHNFALDMNWLPTPVIPRAKWKKVAPVKCEEKRAITLPEHEKILAGERNPE
jgi:hypothetical protein